jgi:tryptophan synthase alpha chain
VRVAGIPGVARMTQVETGIDRIAAAFATAKGRAALMPYLMAGFPDIETSVAIATAYAESGADLVELGVPFSDPLADGPVIHAAATKALEAGANVHAVLEAGQRIAELLPVVLMCYANPLFARGPERFAAELAERGISGLIVPDLPLEESAAVLDACDAHGIALVPLVAPTTPDARLTQIGRIARGFVYTVSVTGTTGERAANATDVASLIARVKAHSPVPVALGFGISTGAQAAAAADAGADGVIVGSRLVRAVAEAAQQGSDPASAAASVVADLADALVR